MMAGQTGGRTVFTPWEKERLMDLIDEDYDVRRIIKHSDPKLNYEKQAAWIKVTGKFRELTGKTVTSKQLQKLYHNTIDRMKKKAQSSGTIERLISQPERNSSAEGSRVKVDITEDVDSDFTWTEANPVAFSTPEKKPDEKKRNVFDISERKALLNIKRKVEADEFQDCDDRVSYESNMARQAMWNKITDIFNERTGRCLKRSEVRKLYANMQHRCRKDKDLMKKIMSNESNPDVRLDEIKLRNKILSEKRKREEDEFCNKRRDTKTLPLQVKWVDHEASIGQAFREMREEGENFDVTLVCENNYQVEAHKVILSACSSFFKQVLRRNPHQHPLLYLRNVRDRELDGIMDYMYLGKALVPQNELAEFLQVAGDLRIKGLVSDLLPFVKDKKTPSEADPKADAAEVKMEQPKPAKESPAKPEDDETENLDEWDDDQGTEDVDEDDGDCDMSGDDDTDEVDAREEELLESLVLSTASIPSTATKESPTELKESSVTSVEAVSTLEAANALSRGFGEDAHGGQLQPSSVQSDLYLEGVAGSSNQPCLDPDAVAANSGCGQTGQPCLQPQSNLAHPGSSQNHTCKTCGQNFGNSAVALMIHQSRDHTWMV